MLHNCYTLITSIINCEFLGDLKNKCYFLRLLAFVKSHVIEEINQFCSTYQSVPLYCLSWEKVEIRLKSLYHILTGTN